MATLSVLGSTMYYEEQGAGRPVVFLHGNPTSSHVWRKVMAEMPAAGRLLAPDLIGMGQSGKPSIRYDFDDHARYLDAWFDAAGLSDVVLVGHDWGGSLALDWAARHPGRVAGVAFMETVVRPMTWADFPGPARERFEALRTPGTGEAIVLGSNDFLEKSLAATILHPLAAEDLNVYRAPYQTRESRLPLLQWPRAFPIDGLPKTVVERVDAYDSWLAASLDVPKLLLTFDGPPGTLLIGEEAIGWCETYIAGLSVAGCGPARHNAPEDQPAAIAAAVIDWMRQNDLH
ncbi:haloalkane dehalogenase [Burkholderia arboris]|uniref:haloalkane dehalogenase n=1 Tax=Burkholderia arboris TaxID=488730 RepID=UPI00210BF50D|nr:haloalkane dehalogenase [Burkholderia arboris]UTV56005.1 haloalkane dehalogenase [Burkholderia arboris]